MAVYKRSYRGYSGEITPVWSRFLVLYRFSRRTLFRSKIQTVFFALCFFFPLLCLLGIYANSHLSALTFLGQRPGPFLDVNGRFFSVYLDFQAALAFLLTAFIGPGLVSPDLSNGALTLYLCRPLSRTEYVLGKMSVLFITLSWITWLPGLVLFFVQASHLRLAMDVGQPLDHRRHRPWLADLDHRTVSRGAGAFGLGAMAHRRRRPAARACSFSALDSPAPSTPSSEPIMAT